jgi:hypothetical protein
MKRLLLIIFIILYPCLLHAEMSNISEITGNDWKTLSYANKTAFTLGVISSANYVAKQNISYSPIVSEQEYDTKKAIALFSGFEKSKSRKVIVYNKKEVDLMREHTRRTGNYLLRRYSILRITNIQLYEGLEKLYDDFKNTNILLNEAVYLVRKQIQGASDEEIQAILLWLRTPANQRTFDQLIYTDKMGKAFYATFP